MKSNNLDSRKEKVVEHTPTPWRIYTKGQYDAFSSIRTAWAFGICADTEKHEHIAIIDVQDNKDSGFDVEKANAEFIVTACNAHEDLVNELKEVSGYWHKQNHPNIEFKDCFSPVCEDSRKALAKAGVKP